MSDAVARSIARVTLRGLSLAGVVFLSLSLPAIWLAWEAVSAREEAGILAQAASDSVQAELHDLLARFERGTAGIRPQDVQGDPTLLTARLLRAEPLVAPANDLLVINARGQQVASSVPGTSAISVPAALLRALSAPRGQEAVTLVADISAPTAPAWMLVRRIEDAQGGVAAVIAAALPQGALRTLIAPTSRPAGSLDFTARAADGKELLRSPVDRPASMEAMPLVDLYRAFLPVSWLTPLPTEVTANAGNVTWTVSATSSAALELRATQINRHGWIVISLACGFAALVLLCALIPAPRSRKFGSEKEAAEAKWRATCDALECELMSLRRTLDGMASERNRVLAAIGHDVRTPINSILGICAVLMNGDLGDAQRKWLQRIRTSGETLLAMLNGMLEIAAAAAGGVEIHREPVDVATLVEEIGEVLRPQAQDKGLELFVAVDEGVLGTWNTDPTRLRQVLFNLGDNAVKYTIQGSVEIKASISGAEVGQEMLRFQVSDSGPGIAEEERDIIFEHYRRGRAEVSAGQEGLGLGLALCREIAALLEGSLSVKSTHAVGTVFTFEIPIERVQSRNARGAPLTGRTALIVGLSESLRRRIASRLESTGFAVETSEDGFVGLGLAERAAFQHGALDLLILDAALDRLPADALLMRLRANPVFQRTRTVLVANGPVAMPASRQADMVLSHPVGTGDLDRVVVDFFGTNSLLKDVDPQAPAVSGLRVLVVEDNGINQAVFVDVLDRAGFSVFAVSSGEEAVQAAERGQFDAILMDVQMPGIDGMEATRRIRAAGREKQVPIIGLTAHFGPAIQKKCLYVGMDLVLHKPVDLSRLPMRLREVVGTSRLAAIAGGNQIDEEAMEEGTALEVAEEYLEALIAGIGIERTRASIMAFLAETEVQIPRLEQFEAWNNWEPLGDLAHSLAAAAGTLGALTLADGLLMLEDATRIKEKVRVMSALEDVQMTWRRTRKLLNRRFEALTNSNGPSINKAA